MVERGSWKQKKTVLAVDQLHVDILILFEIQMIKLFDIRTEEEYWKQKKVEFDCVIVKTDLSNGNIPLHYGELYDM